MPGVIANFAAVVVGSLIGLLFHKNIPDKIADAIMVGIGLCTICIGITGMVEVEHILVVIVSIVMGTSIGTFFDLDQKIGQIGEWLQSRSRRNPEKVSISEGFVTASLLFCVGSMTVLGSIHAGIEGNYQLLYTKSVLDFISALMLTVSLGFGVIFSAGFVLLFQGGLVLIAGLIAPVVTTSMLNDLNCTGSILILALGLNLIRVTRIKVANYLPALLLAPFFTLLFQWLEQIHLLNF